MPGKGVGSQEPPLRVGPIGSLVLRPKPSPIGLASPFPEGTGRVGIRGFSDRTGALGGSLGSQSLQTSDLGAWGWDFIVKGGMGNSWLCSALPAAAGAGEPRGPEVGGARVGGGGEAATRIQAPGTSG